MVAISRQLPYTVVPASPRRCAARDVRPPHTAKLEPEPSMNSTSPVEATSIALTTVPSRSDSFNGNSRPYDGYVRQNGLKTTQHIAPIHGVRYYRVGVFRNRRIRSASDHVFTLELFRGGLIRLFQRSISAFFGS